MRTAVDERPGAVPRGSRPTADRAAAAARLAGAAAGPDAVKQRLKEAARRSEAVAPPGRPRSRAIANPGAATPLFGSAAAALRVEPLPEEKVRPRHLRVVPPGSRSAAQRRRRARAVLIAAIGAASCIAFVLVYLHVVLAQRQFQIDKLNSNVTKAQASYQNLRLQVAQLGSPQQIISTAEGRLGMVQPAKVVYLTPPASTSAGTPTAAAPGTDTSAGGGASVVSPNQAPAGDADWPRIKSQLAGAP